MSFLKIDITHILIFRFAGKDQYLTEELESLWNRKLEDHCLPLPRELPQVEPHQPLPPEVNKIAIAIFDFSLLLPI
jgi:hypothetical protein